MHVASTFPDNYVYGKCTYYIWEYGEIGENNTYLRTDHVPQVYIPCRIPCSSLVQYSINCSLITRYSTKTQLQEPATSYQRYACVPPLLLPQFCCYMKHCQVRVYSGRGSGQVRTKTDEGQGQGAGQGVSPAGVGDRLDSTTMDNKC